MHELRCGLTLAERRFLLSFAAAEPEWSLLNAPRLREPPGLRWKLDNLKHRRETNTRKFVEQQEKLARVLG